MSMAFYRTTVEIVGEAKSLSEFRDGITDLLTEQGIFGKGSVVRNWAYRSDPVKIKDPTDFAVLKGAKR